MHESRILVNILSLSRFCILFVDLPNYLPSSTPLKLEESPAVFEVRRYLQGNSPRRIKVQRLYYTTLSIFLGSFDLTETNLRIADLENTDLENVVCVLLEKPKESWHCSFVNNFCVFFPWSCQSLCYEFAGLMSHVRTQTSVSTVVFNASYLLF